MVGEPIGIFCDRKIRANKFHKLVCPSPVSFAMLRSLPFLFSAFRRNDGHPRCVPARLSPHRQRHRRPIGGPRPGKMDVQLPTPRGRRYAVSLAGKFSLHVELHVFLCQSADGTADVGGEVLAALHISQEDTRSPLDSVARQARDMLAPTRESIGPYKVIERIGAGGMGAVYLAQREADFDQQVAIKIVPTLFEQPDMLDRFRNERQILADLDHPNIARLLDGGTTEDGLPYLVMEYVKGLPIDEYCWENSLVHGVYILYQWVCDDKFS